MKKTKLTPEIFTEKQRLTAQAIVTIKEHALEGNDSADVGEEHP